MARVLPLGGKYGGFETREEWRRSLEKEGLYDPVTVGIEARDEAARAKFWAVVGTLISLTGTVLSAVALWLCH